MWWHDKKKNQHEIEFRVNQLKLLSKSVSKSGFNNNRICACKTQYFVFISLIYLRLNLFKLFIHLRHVQNCLRNVVEWCRLSSREESEITMGRLIVDWTYRKSLIIQILLISFVMPSVVQKLVRTNFSEAFPLILRKPLKICHNSLNIFTHRPAWRD